MLIQDFDKRIHTEDNHIIKSPEILALYIKIHNKNKTKTRVIEIEIENTSEQKIVFICGYWINYNELLLWLEKGFDIDINIDSKVKLLYITEGLLNYKGKLIV